MGFLFDSYSYGRLEVTQKGKGCRTFGKREYIRRKWREIETVRGRERERERKGLRISLTEPGWRALRKGIWFGFLSF